MPNTLHPLIEFIQTFKGSLDPRLWMKLVVEETKELEVEVTEGNKEYALKELADLIYVSEGFLLVGGANVQFLLSAEEYDQWTTYVAAATKAMEAAVETFGFTDDVLEEAFKRVHESNMSKLGEDGKPIFREDGKVLKGPNYKPAYVGDLV